jgi:hypothetical protein
VNVQVIFQKNSPARMADAVWQQSVNPFMALAMNRQMHITCQQNLRDKSIKIREKTFFTAPQ